MEALRSVADGRGRVLLLTGAAGAGKTRRAAALAEEARGAGFTVAWAAGGRPGAPPFWPWHQVLRALPVADGDPATPLPAGLPEGGTWDLRARFELFEDVVARLAEAARSAPLLVVLDDLHEADAASLLLAQHLAAVIRSLPVLVVATVRTDLAPAVAEWPEVWADLVRHGEVVTVGPLDDTAVADLLREATGAADPALVRRIVDRTGGNALFVTELVRWCAASGGDVEALPDTVRAVIGARVAERSAGCRRVLSAAATVGPRSPVALVVDALGEPVGEVLAAVDEATSHGLLDAADPDRVVFAHAIVRDAVYEAQPPAHRAHWHRVVAEHLAATGDAAGAAHHFRLGGPQVRAAAWATTCTWATATASGRPCSGRATATAASRGPTRHGSTRRPSWTRSTATTRSTSRPRSARRSRCSTGCAA